MVLSCSLSSLQDCLDRLPLVQYCARRETLGVLVLATARASAVVVLAIDLASAGSPKSKELLQTDQGEERETLDVGQSFDLVWFWRENWGRLQFSEFLVCGHEVRLQASSAIVWGLPV